MKKTFLIILGLVCFGGCATSSQTPFPAMNPLSISDLESFSFGRTSTAEAINKFGKPHEIVRPKNTNSDVWVYYSELNGEHLQRLALTVNRETQIVDGALWSLRNSDALHDLKNALSHFSKAKFRIEDVGLIARHDYSDDATYTDESIGISLEVNKTPKTVASVSFGPRTDRALSNSR